MHQIIHCIQFTQYVKDCSSIELTRLVIRNTTLRARGPLDIDLSHAACTKSDFLGLTGNGIDLTGAEMTPSPFSLSQMNDLL